MKNTLFDSLAVPAALTAMALFLLPARLSGQGSLTPPGAPAPTMKTLQQIEPRTPISEVPFTISGPGSYYMTTNLTLGKDNGITIAANDVTLDLGGFVLTGVGTDFGIYVSGDRTNLVVCNGTIRDWSTCVEASTASNARFENLQASGASAFGLNAGNNALVRSCQAMLNGFGISVSEGCTIKDCVTLSNSLTGIYAYAGSSIVHCTADGNRRGIEGDEGCLIQSCVVRNGGDNLGIVGSDITVLDCMVYGNQSDGIKVDRGTVKDCTSRNNTGDGIDVFINCHVVGNACGDNTGAGITCSMGGHTLEGNMATGNAFGFLCTTTGNLIIRNRPSGNSTNYNIGAFNTAGPVITSSAIATNSNPHANYSY